MSGMGTGSGARAGLQIGFVEPHLRRYGGIRRMVEFANRLVDRGHDVVFYLPETQDLRCTWMPCRARVKPIGEGFDDLLDIVCFNHEPQWYLLEHFRHARRRLFYALHYGPAYGKGCCWEALRAPVDLVLANSNWTADQIAAETGHRPTVQLGGVNRETFRPYGGPKRYPLLCAGDGRRAWKGTATIEEAARRLGLPLEQYSTKDLGQAALGREYAAAEVFAVGSWFEGFCQPGLEALACGTPLVTTDNGGCLEYAHHEETALVVPPRDAEAMADAIARLRADPALAERLRGNGLDVVDRDFDWERRTDEFVDVLDGLSAGRTAPPPSRPEPPAEPELSIVALQWNGLLDTQGFVESVRRNTDVPYELILVDNGSDWEAAEYVRAAADHAVLNAENRGFAAGMNQGLAVARGRYVAFCNNDTVMPPAWASRLLETAAVHERAGIVCPALTAGRNPYTVREQPGETIEVLPPFSAPPSAVIYVMPTALARELGGWAEEYAIASGEDLDLAFQVWVNDLDIVFDERVLVAHIGKGAASRLDDWRALWAQNRQRFLDKWSGHEAVVQLDRCDPERFARNRATARAAAEWMARFFAERDARAMARPPAAAVAAAAAVAPVRRRLARVVPRLLPAWRRVRPLLPERYAERLRIAAKTRLAPGTRGATVAASAASVPRVSGVREDGGPAATVDRRAEDASRWLLELRALAARSPGPPAPRLVRSTDGAVFVVEGTSRRRVPSGLVAAALALRYGPARAANADDLETLTTGPPVQVFQVPGAPPFVVVGGRRVPVRGLPDTFPTTAAEVDAFPLEAEPLDIARANGPRTSARAGGRSARGSLAWRVARQARRRARAMSGVRS